MCAFEQECYTFDIRDDHSVPVPSAGTLNLQFVVEISCNLSHANVTTAPHSALPHHDPTCHARHDA